FTVFFGVVGLVLAVAALTQLTPTRFNVEPAGPIKAVATWILRNPRTVLFGTLVLLAVLYSEVRRTSTPMWLRDLRANLVRLAHAGSQWVSGLLLMVAGLAAIVAAYCLRFW